MPKLFKYGRFKRSTEPSACCPQGFISTVGWEPFRHFRQVSWQSTALHDLPLKYLRSSGKHSVNGKKPTISLVPCVLRPSQQGWYNAKNLDTRGMAGFRV